MKVIVPYSNKGLDESIAEAFAAGVRAFGDEAVTVHGGEDDPLTTECDAAMVFGVKARAKYETYRARGVHTIMVDKGYIRTHMPDAKVCKFWRVAVDSHHPTPYLAEMNSPSDRWEGFDIEFRPWRRSGSHIMIAGSSAKYHAFNGLNDPSEFAYRTARQIRRVSPLPIYYRPKPSWRDAVPIKGTLFSHPKDPLWVGLRDCHAMVTSGSNACFEAVLAGVPCIVLGEAVARPISSTSIEEIESPRLANDAERWQWLSNLAYCQWELSEFRSGEAWAHLRKRIDAVH